MMEQHQLKEYVREHYLASLLKQVPLDQDLSHGMLTLALKVNLAKTIRDSPDIAALLIGNYIQFRRTVELTLEETFKERGTVLPSYGIHVAINIYNCSLPRHNLECPEFLSSLFEQKTGLLVFLKDCRIVAAHQPELYLSSWT